MRLPVSHAHTSRPTVLYSGIAETLCHTGCITCGIRQLIGSDERLWSFWEKSGLLSILVASKGSFDHVLLQVSCVSLLERRCFCHQGAKEWQEGDVCCPQVQHFLSLLNGNVMILIWSVSPVENKVCQPLLTYPAGAMAQM